MLLSSRVSIYLRWDEIGKQEISIASPFFDSSAEKRLPGAEIGRVCYVAVSTKYKLRNSNNTYEKRLLELLKKGDGYLLMHHYYSSFCETGKAVMM